MRQVPVDGCINLIVDQAFRYYREFQPETSEDAFKSQFLEPVCDLGAQAGERLLKALLKVEQSEPLFDATFAPMLISLGFAGQAFFEENRGEHELALLVLMEAKYWSGVMWASRGVRVAERKTVEETAKKTRSKAGITAGQARYSELREYTRTLALSEIDPAAPPPKASELARMLMPKVHAFAIENKLTPLKGGPSDDSGSDSGQITLERWLRDLADKGLIQLRRQQRE